MYNTHRSEYFCPVILVRSITMNNFVLSAHAVLPMFLIMAVGYLIKCTGLMDRSDVFKINKVSFHVFLPCMLFYSIYTSDISGSIRPSLMAYAILSVLIIYLISWIFINHTEPDIGLRSVSIQGLFRSNYVIMGIPIAIALLGKENIGAVSVMVGIVVPLYNVLAVICLEHYNGRKTSLKDHFIPILKNPLIISSAIGILFLVLKVRLPYSLDAMVSGLGDIAAPLQLFLLGVFFDFKGMKKFIRQLITVNTGKLIIFPAVFLTVAYLLGFRQADFVSLMGIYAAPTAINSFTMAQQMGGNEDLAGSIVVSTTAVSILTMFLWILIFKTLGAY